MGLCYSDFFSNKETTFSAGGVGRHSEGCWVELLMHGGEEEMTNEEEKIWRVDEAMVLNDAREKFKERKYVGCCGQEGDFIDWWWLRKVVDAEGKRRKPVVDTITWAEVVVVSTVVVVVVILG